MPLSKFDRSSEGGSHSKTSLDDPGILLFLKTDFWAYPDRGDYCI